MQTDEKSHQPDINPEDYSMPHLIGLADSTMCELNEFRQEVLKNYSKRKLCVWVNGPSAAKMLGVTVRTLRRYRCKYKIRVSMINGTCRYYYPDLLALITKPAK